MARQFRADVSEMSQCDGCRHYFDDGDLIPCAGQHCDLLPSHRNPARGESRPRAWLCELCIGDEETHSCASADASDRRSEYATDVAVDAHLDRVRGL